MCNDKMKQETNLFLEAMLLNFFDCLGLSQLTKIALVVAYMTKNNILIEAVLSLIRVRLGTNYKDNNLILPL